MIKPILESLEAPTGRDRVAALAHALSGPKNPARTVVDSVPGTEEVNNHVHTRYSFSPYTPTQAAFMARAAGLMAVGSVDHDSIGAAEETIEACKVLRIGSTVGFECRVSFASTSMAEHRLNNPDSIGIGYIVVHGVPRPRIADAVAFLKPIQDARNERNRRQVTAMSGLLTDLGAPAVSFDDVESASLAADGGSITERHILYVAARQLMQWRGVGRALREWVEKRITGPLPSKLTSMLDDSENPHYVYDLLGALKSSFLPRFFIQPNSGECIPVGDVVGFANRINAIPAYAYLGDVGESPTGDKKAQKFEDDFLDDLFEVIHELGFRAVTYMPPRNTLEQLMRVQALCSRHALMEISGVDINSSRQVFTCPEILQPEFHHLIDATWALIAHEKMTSVDPDHSLFGPLVENRSPLKDRIRKYADIGRQIDPARPEEIPGGWDERQG